MTTTAFHQYCNIPFLGGSYNAYPVQGARNTSNTPAQMPQHNHGWLSGSHPNPPHFANDNASESFALQRAQYMRTTTTQNNFGVGHITATSSSSSKPSSHFVPALHRSFPMSQTTSYVAPKCASLYLHAKKSAAVGKSSFKIGLSDSAPLSYGKATDTNVARSRLRRARSSGAVAPPKCRAVNNPSRGSNSHWGANGVGGVRATY